MTDARPLVFALTGASGAPYAVRILEVLARNRIPVWLIVSRHGWRLLDEECGITDVAALEQATGGDWSSISVFDDGDRGAKPASGSQKTRGMLVCPCSMGTVAAIAHGTSRSLVERAADVTLKEGRKLVVVPRETPLSLVHLRNLVAAAEAGVTVLPGAPGFYHRPKQISDLVDFIAQRVIDQFDLEIDIAPGGAAPNAERIAMRLGIISDTHGLLRPEVFDAFRQVDLILHAGDIGEPGLLTELEAIAPVQAVYGNTDGFDIRRLVPEVIETEIEGFRFVVVHGHQFDRVTPEALNLRYPDAEVIIYGHTHQPLLTIVDTVVTVMNPGGAGARRFDLPASVGIMELEPGIPPRARLVPLTEFD